MKTLRQQAIAVCDKYQQVLLQGHHEHEAEAATVSSEAKDRTVAYIQQWPKALPLRGVIIGQAPQDTDKLPPLAASFAHDEGEKPTLFASILAHQMCLCCPGANHSSLVEAIRDCWKLTDKGVLSVHACPLGITKGSRPAQRKPWDNVQIDSLSETLAELLALTSHTASSGRVTVVAVGKWAELVAQRVEDSLHRDDAQWASGWILERHNLYHPGFVWHKYHTERVRSVVMGDLVGMRALHTLFMAASAKPTTAMEASSSNQVQGPAQVGKSVTPPTSSTRKPTKSNNYPKPSDQDQPQGEPAGGSEEQEYDEPPKPAETTIQDVLKFLAKLQMP